MDEEGVRHVGVADCSTVANDASDALRLAEEHKDLVNLRKWGEVSAELINSDERTKLTR